MNDIEELQHVLEVLKRYDLPISPILEYSIMEKIESLSHVEEVPAVITEPPINAKEDIGLAETNQNGKKKIITTIRGIRSNGSIIENKKAAQTLSSTIKEIGSEKVYDLKIPMDGMFLVTQGGNPNYPSP